MTVAIWTDRRQNQFMGEKRQTRHEQVQEAEKIFSWLVSQRELAGDLIRTSAKIVDDKEEAADTRLDLHMIAKALAAATKPGSRNAVWQDYQHHFVSDEHRKKFFDELHDLTKSIASVALVSVWKPVQVRNFTKIRRFAKRLPSARVVKISQVACKSKGNTDLPVRWNPQLLPESIAPYVLRLAILHPGVLENFLPRFFVKASDFLTQKSTYRRAILILHAVPRFGWSDEKHTKMLIELGALDLLQDGSEVETVKKFIRDLRRRYQKYLNEKAQASA